VEQRIERSGPAYACQHGSETGELLEVGLDGRCGVPLDPQPREDPAADASGGPEQQDRQAARTSDLARLCLRPRRPDSTGREPTKSRTHGTGERPTSSHRLEQTPALSLAGRPRGFCFGEQALELVHDPIAGDGIQSTALRCFAELLACSGRQAKAEPSRVAGSPKHPGRIIPEAPAVKRSDESPFEVQPTSERIQQMRAGSTIEGECHCVDREVSTLEVLLDRGRSDDGKSPGGRVSFASRLREVDPKVRRLESRREKATMDDGTGPEPLRRCPSDGLQRVRKEQIHVQHRASEDQIAHRSSDEVRRRALLGSHSGHEPDGLRAGAERTVEPVAEGWGRRVRQGHPSPRGCRVSTMRPRRVVLTCV
jgi:hypothetical protein